MKPSRGEELLTPGEVARVFRVDPKTVTRWARQGRLTFVRTPGGHRRFLWAEVNAMLQAGGRPSSSAAKQQPTREQAAQLLARYVPVDWRSLLADQEAVLAAHKVAARAAMADTSRYLEVNAARDRLIEGP